jgi:hypothetical protein
MIKPAVKCLNDMAWYASLSECNVSYKQSVVWPFTCLTHGPGTPSLFLLALMTVSELLSKDAICLSEYPNFFASWKLN